MVTIVYLFVAIPAPLRRPPSCACCRGPLPLRTAAVVAASLLVASATSWTLDADPVPILVLTEAL